MVRGDDGAGVKASAASGGHEAAEYSPSSAGRTGGDPKNSGIGFDCGGLGADGCLGYEVYQFRHGSALLERNFYGALRVNDEGDGLAEARIRRLTHGTINHGEQFLDEARHMQPTTYYGYHSGVGVGALERNRQRPAVRVGVIGLGTGTQRLMGERRCVPILRYQSAGDPGGADRVQLFCATRKPGSRRCWVTRGLSLEREQPQEYEFYWRWMRFSSGRHPGTPTDAEAFALYFQHLKTDGVLAVHVSNKHLNLQPIVQMAADAMGKLTTVIDTNDEDDNAVFGATWVLMTSRETFSITHWCGKRGNRWREKPGCACGPTITAIYFRY